MFPPDILRGLPTDQLTSMFSVVLENMFSCQWYRIRAILRSIYVHSFTDDEGRFHIMLVKLNSIQPFSVYQEIISHIRGLVSIRTSRYIWLLLIHGTGCKTKKSLRNLWNKCEAGASRKFASWKVAAFGIKCESVIFSVVHFQNKCDFVAANGSEKQSVLRHILQCTSEHRQNYWKKQPNKTNWPQSTNN